ncbi:MAG: hypothetical protein AAFZ52_03765 [Bacteroidota bacterium]
MTAQEFNRYLDAPEQLYELPLPELQQLALRYPYSANLRLLLLLKARLEEHPNAAAYLERCAAASFDRAFLYDILQELDGTGTITTAAAAEDTLELRALDELQAELLPLEDSSSDTERLVSVPPPLAPKEPLPLAPAPAPTTVGSSAAKKMPAQVPVAPAFDYPAWAATATAYLDSLPAPLPVATDQPTPAPTSPPIPSLAQRLRRIRRIQEQRQEHRRDQVDRIARRSLVAHEAVASETLARLLTQQGQYQHAIKMYRRLILLYPEKKTIFAGLIKDLQKKL